MRRSAMTGGDLFPQFPESPAALLGPAGSANLAAGDSTVTCRRCRDSVSASVSAEVRSAGIDLIRQKGTMAA